MLLVLAALLLPCWSAATAEEVVYNDESLLGVWVSEERSDLALVILPGSYAECFGQKAAPSLFMECRWPEGAGWSVLYRLNLGQIPTQTHPIFGTSFFGAAINSITSSSANASDWENAEDSPTLYDRYESGSVSIVVDNGEDDISSFPFNETTSGALYLYTDEDQPVLYWVDDHDPHTLIHFYTRDFVEAPGAEALAERVIRPVIDMADDAFDPTVQTLMGYAIESRLSRVETTELQSCLDAALSDLSDEELQTFSEHAKALLPHLTEALLHMGVPGKPYTPVAEELWSCHILAAVLQSALRD